MTSKPQFVGERVRLGELISKAAVVRCGNGSYPVYSMTMHDGIVEQAGRFKKAIASKDTSAYKVVKKNQLVVGFPIDEGVLYVQNFDKSGIMSPAYGVWDINLDRVLPSYLDLALHSPQCMAYYKEKMRGTTARRRTLTADALCSLEIPLPPIQQQGCIVEMLDTVKLQINHAHNVIYLFDSLVKSRFVEMFGDVSENSKCWPTNYLGELGELRNGVNFKSEDSGCEIRCLGVGDFKDRHSISDMKQISTVKLTSMPTENQMLCDGDIVFVRSNGNKRLVGRCLVVYPGDIALTFSGFCIRFRNTYDQLLVDYLLNCLKSESMRNAMTGRGGNIQNLTQSLLSNLQIPIPPLALQQEFAGFVAQVDKPRFVAQ
ncbi:MAG: restriction endonuclease subunit S [Coriobacteriales bacterium]